jgi:hypothetical protein
MGGGRNNREGVSEDFPKNKKENPEPKWRKNLIK